jgi:hypothetical protein
VWQITPRLNSSFGRRIASVGPTGQATAEKTSRGLTTPRVGDPPRAHSVAERVRPAIACSPERVGQPVRGAAARSSRKGEDKVVIRPGYASTANAEELRENRIRRESGVPEARDGEISWNLNGPPTRVEPIWGQER